jgi:hypothetical protein
MGGVSRAILTKPGGRVTKRGAFEWRILRSRDKVTVRRTAGRRPKKSASHTS